MQELKVEIERRVLVEDLRVTESSSERSIRTVRSDVSVSSQQRHGRTSASSSLMCRIARSTCPLSSAWRMSIRSCESAKVEVGNEIRGGRGPYGSRKVHSEPAQPEGRPGK